MKGKRNKWGCAKQGLYGNQNKIISTRAKLCNFLDCRPNLNMQMRLLPQNKKNRKNIKICEKPKFSWF